MWLSNPIVDPLFWSFLKVAGSALGVALVILLVLEWRHLRELHRRELFRRLFTWACIALLYSATILSGRIPVLLLTCLMIFQGLREYATLVGLPRIYRWVLIGMGVLAPPAAFHSPLAFYVLPALLLLVATLQPLLIRDSKGGVRHLAFAVFGWSYVAWLLGHIMLIYLYVPQGSGLLLALVGAVALSDVAAFAIGKPLGRHKLAPRLSPNKTWEGMVGNFLGAYLGMGIMYVALRLDLPGYLLWTFPAVIAAGALWGDLLESAIKREFEVKDAGQWLPGFGGLLDRIDSLLLVLPLAFYTLSLTRLL